MGVIAADNKSWEAAEGPFPARHQARSECGARPELARTCLDYAEMLSRRSGARDIVRAADLLTEAGLMFDELAMPAFVSRASELASWINAAVPAPAVETRYPDRLSAREVEVLLLVARGRSNQQIADDLVLSVKTVARHISNIFNKTGVSNRSAATAYAFEHGLAPVPAS
jgi:DNA-binding NarL/FixJ family response regulator